MEVITRTMKNIKQLAPNGPINTASTLPHYVTVQQIAEMLAVNERSVLRWAAQEASMPVSSYCQELWIEED